MLQLFQILNRVEAKQSYIVNYITCSNSLKNQSRISYSDLFKMVMSSFKRSRPKKTYYHVSIYAKLSYMFQPGSYVSWTRTYLCFNSHFYTMLNCKFIFSN